MKYLLDTNALIALHKGTPAIMDQIQKYMPADFGVPAVVIQDLYYGAYKSQRSAGNLTRAYRARRITVSTVASSTACSE